MATLDEKITRVENNVAASLEAAAEMGAEVPEGANSDSLPGLIRSIPKNSSDGIWDNMTETPPGVEVVDGDTVTWNGDSDKLEKIALPSSGGNVSGWVKLSDTAPSYRHFTGGGEPDAENPLNIGSYLEKALDASGETVKTSSFNLFLPADNCYLDEYTGSFLYRRNSNSMAIDVVCAVEEFEYWNRTFQRGLWVCFEQTEISNDGIYSRYIEQVSFDGYTGLTDAAKIKGSYLPSSVVQTDPEQTPNEGDVLTYTRSEGAVWLAAAPGGGDSTLGLFAVGIADMEEGTVTCTASEILEMANQGRPVVLRYPLGEPGSFMEYHLYRATSESVAFHAPADRFDNGDINIGMIVVHDGNHFYMDQIFINQETEVETVYDWDGECSLTTEEIYEKSTMAKAVIFRDTGDFEHEETTEYVLWHSDASSAEFRSPVVISDNGEASVKIVRVTAPNAVSREEKVISVTAESIKEVLGYTPADEENAKQMVVTFAYDANGSLTCTPGVDELFAAHRAGRTVVAEYEKARLTLSNAASATLDFTAEDWLRAEYKMIRVSEAGSISYFTGKIADGKLDKNQGEENYGKVMGVNLRGEVVPVKLNLDNVGGASSWNDLPDRPVVLEGTPDTVTWDGNTEGRATFTVNTNIVFYKVADAVPKFDELPASVNIKYRDIYGDSSWDGMSVTQRYAGVVGNASGWVWFVDQEGVGHTFANGDTIPEPGTYFMVNPSEDGYTVVTSLTIPGYTGFATEKFDPAYLYQPDWEQTDEAAPDFVKNKPFGETVVMGDTLTWDGNTEGLMRVEGEGGFLVLYKVSNATPSIEDFASGASYDATGPDGNPNTTELTANDIESLIDGIILVDMVIVVHENAANVELEDMGGLSFPEPGTYFASSADGSYISSLTIPGYTGFQTKTVKPLDKKYLPGDLIPAYTEADEGKVLKIVNGAPAWVSIPSAEEASF